MKWVSFLWTAINWSNFPGFQNHCLNPFFRLCRTLIKLYFSSAGLRRICRTCCLKMWSPLNFAGAVLISSHHCWLVQEYADSFHTGLFLQSWQNFADPHTKFVKRNLTFTLNHHHYDLLDTISAREEYFLDYFVNKSIKEDKNATYPISNFTLSGLI